METMEEGCFHQLGAGIQLLGVSLDLVPVTEGWVWGRRKSWLLDSSCGYQHKCPATKSKGQCCTKVLCFVCLG